ncbi:DUF488 domain-containing protein [Flavobacterium psychraquaticum]|uniref:DUF488 domain-containing protein n=1 Tax=Flavobacterium psychraquaticum TaxID=3103958 RepID=UPI002ACEE5DA|nr:DUF488 family protein [Flavobacterium sp. LB-N7T]
MQPIVIKRVYEEASENDGYRILVDRLWPRGISREKVNIDEWDKNIAPSTEHRKWFDHKEERFQEFTIRYKEELLKQEEELNRVRKIAATEKVTLLYGAKNQEINHAVILSTILNQTL